MGVWSRKSIELMRQEAHGGDNPALKRSLGVLDLTSFGVGNTIGAGILVLTGTVAAQNAGPAVTLCFILASLACFFAGLCYAEFAAMVPVAGSAYSYAYATFGELLAWLIGWNVMFEYLFSASVVAVSWSGYTTSFLADHGIHLPAYLTNAPLIAADGHHLTFSGAWINLPAVLVTLACTGLLLFGIRRSATVNTLIVVANCVAIMVLVAACAAYVHPSNWQPFIPPNTGVAGSFGWSGVLRGAGVVFFAYIGFDGVSTLAEEARDPQRTMPLSLFYSLAICTALYVGVSLAVTGIADYRLLDVPDPVYHALGLAHADFGWLKLMVAMVAIGGMVPVILGSLLGQVRIFFAMGRDGLLPPGLSRCNERYNTPHIGTLVTGGIAALIAGIAPLDVLAQLISIGTLLAFAFVCFGIIWLRRRHPELHRPFRTPWVPLVPALGALCCLGLMAGLGGPTWKRLGIWVALGLAIYVFYGRHHSRLRDKA